MLIQPGCRDKWFWPGNTGQYGLQQYAYGGGGQPTVNRMSSCSLTIDILTWSHKCWIFWISSPDISVPIDISAASFTFASISSGRISERSEELVYSRVPVGTRQTHSIKEKPLTLHWASEWQVICHNIWYSDHQTNKQKQNSVALSRRVNYTDWATTTYRWNLVPTFVDRTLTTSITNILNINQSDITIYIGFIY
jgi:hypothetical protein